MSDGMGREFTYLSSHATNRYFIPNWGKDRYLCANGLERIEMEIPVSYHSIAQRNLDQLNKGSHPFVIPNKGYDEEKGLLPDLCKIEYYQSFEIL